MLGRASLNRLGTCHPALQRLLVEVDRRLSARKLFDFTVICGHRGREEQEQAFRDGNSEKQWPNSRHNQVPATAVDVAPYPIDWNDEEMFMLLAGYILAVADDMGIEVELGALWKKRDRPHIQLSLRELDKAA